MSQKEGFTKLECYVLGFWIFLFFAIFSFFNTETWSEYLDAMAGFSLIATVLMVIDHLQEKKGG